MFKKEIIIWIRKILYIFILIVCFNITVFIFLSSYEIIFNKDIYFVNSLQRIYIEKIIERLNIDTNSASIYREKQERNFGLPKILKIPILNLKLPLTKEIKSGNNWLTRLNYGHYIIFSDNKNDNIGNIVLYTTKNWRTAIKLNELHIGDNIFLNTNKDWRYMFRITDVAKLSFNDWYIISESNVPVLLLIIEDKKLNINYLFKADFVNIQNIQL